MFGQLKQAQARQLGYKHTIFLRAWYHISGFKQDRTFKPGIKQFLDSFYMIGQLTQAQARKLVYKHTIFLCARDHISGYIQARTFKLGM